jgi:hypothetical protein
MHSYEKLLIKHEYGLFFKGITSKTSFYRMPRKLKLVFVSIGLISVNFNLVANAATVTKGYKDVPKSHWAKDSVVKMVDEYHFMVGDPSGNFAGSRAISRYEFAKTISNMTEYFNTEIEGDRKDLENVVGVLELFQTEMKKMETKVAQAEEQIDSQNKTIAELNELVVTVADELNGVGESGTTKEELESLKTRVAAAEVSIDKLGDKGFLVDTLVKGVGNDAKHLGHAVGNVAKHMSFRKEKEEAPVAESAPVESSSTQNVDAAITAPTEAIEEEVKSAEPAAKHVATPAEVDEFINNLDGYYAAPATEEVEYLTPVH